MHRWQGGDASGDTSFADPWSRLKVKSLIQHVHSVCTIVHLSTGTIHPCSFFWFSLSNESLQRYSSAPPQSPLHVSLTVSLEAGVIVMGAASWIIKHIFFSTIECDLAKWMWMMRAFPSYLYYLTRNGWTMDGQDRGVWATASSHVHYHRSPVFLHRSLSSFIISVILFFLHSSILYASLLASLVIPSCTRCLFVSFCLFLPKGLYLISFLTEM